MMKARDVMVAPVITVKPTASVKEAAEMLVENRISGLPVVDDDGKLVGVVSEGDLLHRVEAGTDRRRSWWLQLFTGDTRLASEYIEAHARKVADVMSRRVITAPPDTPLSDIAIRMEKNAINRVPIVDSGGQLVGIVSRANLVQAIATAPRSAEAPPVSDTEIRKKLMDKLKAQPWAHTELLTLTVSDGVVNLWGIVTSETERKAIRVAAEEMPGVRAVNDHMAQRPFGAES
jgi:CBS domain-containing protein